MNEALKTDAWEETAEAEQGKTLYTAEQVDHILAQTQGVIDGILQGCDARDFLPSGEVANSCLDARNELTQIRSFIGSISS